MSDESRPKAAPETATSASTVTPITDAGRWRKLVRADRRIAQSARQVGDWLSKRPVRAHPGVYSGCQDSCAMELGLSEVTVWRAFKILTDGKYIERVMRGTRYSNCGRYVLLEVDQSTLQFDGLKPA